jgi:acyl-coenzyme A synthetase/AMP-(fatty) acid ligase
MIEIIEASAASLIVTDTENAESARAAGAGRPMLVLDDTVTSAASHTPPTVALSPDTPGFLFFTSGSTVCRRAC